MQNQPLTPVEEDQLAHRLRPRLLLGGLATLVLTAPPVVLLFGVMDGPQAAYVYCLGAIFGGAAVALGVWIQGKLE
jgi:hypothetical protein